MLRPMSSGDSPRPKDLTPLDASTAAAIFAAADLAQIGVAVTVLSPEPRSLYVSEALVKILGHPRELILEQPVLSFLAPEDRGRVAELVGRRQRGEPVPPEVIETWVVTATGARVPIAIAGARLQLGGVPASVSFVWDLSARVQLQQDRQREADHLRRLVASAPDGIVVVQEQRVASINPAGARILGYQAPEALVGRSLAEVLVPEDVAVMGRRMRELAEGAVHPPYVYRARRRDGSLASAEVLSIPIEHEGRPAFLAFVRDVTDREQLRQTMARADRLAALGTLAAGIAHEVSNPLAAAALRLDLLEARMAKVLTGVHLEEVQDAVKDVRASHQRVMEIIRELRAFSRVDDERRALVDVGEVVAGALKMASSTLQRAGAVIAEPGELPPVLANAGRLEQVFVNLLINAAQALPQGRPGNEIRVRGRVVGDQVAVEVVDNGQGIAPEHLGRVFDPFFTTKPVGIGTGLGLAVSHRIVESYGGALEVESLPGQGTTVRVRLPAAAGLQPRPSTPVPPSALRKRRRVLIIDDEPSFAATLKLLLQHQHEAQTATGQAALAAALADPPWDAVLCDLMMPELSGMELYRQVTAARPALAAHFIFMTGGVFTAEAEEFLRAVKAPRLLKPFAVAEIERLIARVAEPRPLPPPG